jgi:hypothetical protein
LFVSSAGLVGIGNSSPSLTLDIKAATDGLLRVNNSNESSHGSSDARIVAGGAYYQNPVIVGSAIKFNTYNGSTEGERLRITSAGLVGIGASSPGALLHLNQSGTGDYSSIRFSNTGASGRAYEIGVGGNTSAAGYANNLYFYDSTGSALRMVLDSSGRLGIGNTAPQNKLVVSNAGAEGVEVRPGDTSNAVDFLAYNRSTAAYSDLQSLAATHRWFIAGNEAARIDSSSRLLVGTSSASGRCNASSKSKAKLRIFCMELASIVLRRGLAPSLH